MINHFNNGLCKGEQYKVNIIETIDGSEMTNRGAMDASFTQIGKFKETYWMKRLRTAFPYDLNDKIGKTIRSDDEILGIKFYLPFFM